MNVVAPPTGWTAVYTVSPTSTDPLSAVWTTAVPGGGLAAVTRIGFIFTGTITGQDPFVLPNTGTPVNGGTPFRFTVDTSDLAATDTGAQIANIAQVFGETVGDPDNEVVYDESGDSQSNNFNDNQTPPDPTGSDYNPAVDTGVADPVTQGIDADNDNTGSGPDGENNVINIGDVAGSDDILNGPDDVPGAVGPTDDNDDFTNRSTNVPEGIGPAATFNPAASTFDNTIQNPAGSGFIADVTLQPISPTQAQGADDSPLTGQYGVNADIPTDTVVTLTATDENNDVLTATYTL